MNTDEVSVTVTDPVPYFFFTRMWIWQQNIEGKKYLFEFLISWNAWTFVILFFIWKKNIYIIWIDVSLAFRKKRTVCPRSHVYICIVTHYMKMDMTFLAAKQPCKSACLSVCLPVCLSACLSEAISPYSKSLQATHPENLWLYPTFCCECHYEKKISNLVLPPVQNDFLCLKLKNLLTTPCNNRNNF